MSGHRISRAISLGLLGTIFAAGLLPNQISPFSYATQFRELPNAAPSALHLLGTDSLGRDLFARVVYGTRISLLLAPLAALLATMIAGVLGCLAGFNGGWLEKAILATADLAMALPLILVLLVARALLPLDVSPALALAVTFVFLGLCGWPTALRVVWAASHRIRESDYVLLARASGLSKWRVMIRHAIPNLRPILAAQFWILIPVFILTEATLSMLGLGVMEPMASWGNLLRGLEDFSAVKANPWMLSPLILLMVVVVSFQFILPQREEIA
jgi:peptide/nickel transport system permease protein